MLLLTANANPRTAIERQVSPTRPQAVPPLRHEFFRIAAKDVSVAVHGVDVVHDEVALFDEERRIPVFAAAVREDRVLGGLASICRDDGMES